MRCRQGLLHFMFIRLPSSIFLFRLFCCTQVCWCFASCNELQMHILTRIKQRRWVRHFWRLYETQIIYLKFVFLTQSIEVNCNQAIRTETITLIIKRDSCHFLLLVYVFLFITVYYFVQISLSINHTPCIRDMNADRFQSTLFQVRNYFNRISFVIILLFT